MWLDHEKIEAREKFAEELAKGLERADILLAIIGPDWLTVEEENGGRRLDDPEDWVRREVEAGLLRDIEIIPVLVGHAQRPTKEELPESLEDLSDWHTIEVRPERFKADLKPLIRSLGGWLWRWILAVTVVAGLVLVVFLVKRNMPPVIDPEQVVAVAGVPAEIDLLSWASDDGDGPLTLISDPVSTKEGSVENLGDGTVRYTAPRGSFGGDSFGFRVRDEGGLETTATAHVDVLLGAMGGAFNIAVAQLAVTGADQGVGLDLAEALYDQIVEVLGDQTEVDVEVAEPAVVGLLSGDTPETRAEAAAELAEQVAADVVVLGTVEESGGLTDVAAEFFVSDRNLTGAEELAGIYPLDTIKLSTTDPLAVTDKTAQTLEPKILALTQLALGLSHYQLNEYPEAEKLFEEALASWPGASGRGVVLSLLGNVTGLQDDLDAAGAYFFDALALDPDDARARFGAAEVAFQRSKGWVCKGSGEADLAGLEDAVSQFEEVGDLPGPPLAFLPERARVEIGRIYECVYVNGGGHLEEARQILEDVIADISHDTRLVDLTADAHFSLGTYHLLKGDQESAITKFEEAVDTTRNDVRKRGFYHSMAVIYLCQLNEPEQAQSYLQQAESIPGPPLDPIQCDA